MGGSAGTLYPHYPRGQCRDIVPVLPPDLGVVRGQCTRTSGGSAGTMFGGGAGTLQGYCVLFAPTVNTCWHASMQRNIQKVRKSFNEFQTLDIYISAFSLLVWCPRPVVVTSLLINQPKLR